MRYRSIFIIAFTVITIILMVVWIYGMMDVRQRRTEDMLREEEEARRQDEKDYRQSSNPDVPFINLPNDAPDSLALKSFGYENYGQGVYQPSGAVEGSRRIIEMTVRRYAFEPDFIVVYEGETVELDMLSLDMLHGLQIKSYNIERTLPRGERRTIKFVADRPGRHEFRSHIYCGPDQHLLTGELIVIARPKEAADPGEAGNPEEAANPPKQAAGSKKQAASPEREAAAGNKNADDSNEGKANADKPDAAPAEPPPPTLGEAARRQMNHE